MTRNEFIQWRKTDFYAEPRDLEIDNCFWCHEQEILFNEVYLAMSEKKRVCPMKAIDFDHLMKKEDYFGTAIRVVDCLGLRHLMDTECNYNVTMVQQFYATVVFDTDVNIGMTWMSDTHMLTSNFGAGVHGHGSRPKVRFGIFSSE